MDSSSDSDYDVEKYIKPDRVRRMVNDDSADLLGNFDDVKRKEILEGTYEDHNSDDDVGYSASEGDTDNDDEEHNEMDEASEDSEEDGAKKTALSKEQLAQLMRGTSKSNRYVLYVTNLNFETTKENLEEHFSAAGTVKSVRIPKKRRGGFAFVEMGDLESYQRGFQLHNTELQGRTIKVQLSEAGKRKSANKKNILKQKNRKLAEMRNEHKAFTKSGKFYDKDLKKEKASELMARKRWRKNPK